MVEQLLTDQFVPNDVHLDNETHQLIVLTGPNMGGKSVYMRQVALIILLSQIGSFVPATEATVPIVDRLFVRSGAADAITAGLSTFMMEMVETAYILKHATKDSVVIMDEIGRGTSTYDGISIAWAVAEYLLSHLHTKTLFATHYLELHELEAAYQDRVKNYHVTVAKENGQTVFLHQIQPGVADQSFGIEVAQLAGVPKSVITSAKQKLDTLHTTSGNGVQLPLTIEQPDHESNNHLLKAIQELDIARTTPLDALNWLASKQAETRD